MRLIEPSAACTKQRRFGERMRRNFPLPETLEDQPSPCPYVGQFPICNTMSEAFFYKTA